MTATSPLLQLTEVSRHFGGIRAVDGISFAVQPGTIHGLIGPNGAGKTTVLNLISGLMPLSAGAIHLGDRRIDGLAPHRIAAAGISRTFQNIRLFPVMTALQNVIAGAHLSRRAGTVAYLSFLPAARAEERRLAERAGRLLDRTGLAERAAVQARDLAYGEQRRLEIARALAGRPRLLLLDEPAAGMPHAEMSQLAELIRAIAADGQTVLLVEHNMELVMSVCERITVLDFGRVIAEGTPVEVTANRAVIDAYLGSDA